MRAEVSKEVIENYFENSWQSLKDVLPENLFDYDEINLTDDPASKTVIDSLKSLKCLKQNLQQNEKLCIGLPGY